MSSLPFSVLDVGKKREREREDKRETQPRSRARTFQAPATDVDLVKIARTMEGMRQLGNADEDDDENDGRNYGDTEVTSSASSASSSSSAMQRKELDARTHDSMLRGTDADPSAPKPVSTRRDWTLQSFDAAASAPSIPALPAPPVVSESFAQQQRQQQLPAPFSSPIESKLDLIIHLLEDQQDMRTDRVVEDMLLYACLGIFIIFAIDTFSTTRRYTR